MWRFSARRWALRMARNPLVRLQLWTRLPSRIWSETDTLAQSGRLRRLCDGVRFLKEPVLQPAPASSPDTAVASTTELSQTAAQVAEAVREVKARTCLGLRPPRSDGQSRSGIARYRPTGTNFAEPTTPSSGQFTARRVGVYDGTACRNACPSGYPLPRTSRRLRPVHPERATLCPPGHDTWSVHSVLFSL